MYDNLSVDQIDFLNWMCNESPTSRSMNDAELEAHYRSRQADDARCEAASNDDADSALIARYPGLANLPDAALAEIAADPQTGLMADAADVVAVARILLQRRGTVAA